MDSLFEGIKFGIGFAAPVVIVTYACYIFLRRKYEKELEAAEEEQDEEENADYRFIASTIVRPPKIVECSVCASKVKRNENE